MERKIAALELKVLPKEPVEDQIAQSVTDMLLQINTLISSALSCRDVVNAILNRMTELNNYLDPNFYENGLTVEAKREFLLAIYPEIRKYGESIQRLKALHPVLDSDPIKNVPSLVSKLGQLTLSTLKTHEEGVEISRSITHALQQYNDIIYSITRTFVELEEIVTQLEFEMKPLVSSE